MCLAWEKGRAMKAYLQFGVAEHVYQLRRDLLLVLDGVHLRIPAPIKFFGE